MNFETFLALSLYSIVASATPGPNNLMFVGFRCQFRHPPYRSAYAGHCNRFCGDAHHRWLWTWGAFRRRARTYDGPEICGGDLYCVALLEAWHERIAGLG